MKKKMLLFGASLSVALGSALLVLTLALTSVAFASAETGTDLCAQYICTKGGGLCVSSTCDSTACGCPDKPDSDGRCPCATKTRR